MKIDDICIYIYRNLKTFELFSRSLTSFYACLQLLSQNICRLK